MRGTIQAVLLLAFMLLPEATYACSYPEPSSFQSALSEATSVFVFRLDQAEYKRTSLGDGAYMDWVEGKIQPIQNLYGDPTQYNRVKFSTSWCGGVNLVVGHHYLIATSASGNTIELATSDNSVLDIDGFYDPRRKQRNLKSFLILPVIQAIYGVRPLPKDFPPSQIAGRTVVQPPPPPPPPPPPRPE